MSDSKGAAIEKIEKLVYAIKNDGHLNGHATIEKPWVDQILAILAQEVNKAVVAELKALKHSFDTDRKTMDFSPATYDFIIDKRLSQLGAKDAD